MADLFGSFVPSLQIIQLLQKKYGIFMFIGMTLGLLVFKNVKILFLTWHAGRRLWKKCLGFGNLMRTETLVVVFTCRNFWEGFLIPVIATILFTSSHFWRAHRCCVVFSVSILFRLEQPETGQEFTWNINFTWLLLGRHLKIYHVNCHPASDHYFLMVIIPELLWLTVILLGVF